MLTENYTHTAPYQSDNRTVRIPERDNLENEDNYEAEYFSKSFDNPKIRMGFTRKVFCLLTLQLLVIFGSILTTKCVNSSKLFFQSEAGIALFYTSMVCMFVTIIFMSCFSNICRKYPQNYVLFSLFTIFMSYILSFTTINYDNGTILLAIGTTLSISIALSIYAIQTKYDFTNIGAYLVVLVVGLIVATIINIFIQNTIFTKIIATIGIIVFSCFIVYDVQLIVGGKHRRYSYDIDDYIFATINISLDIINLFLYILELFGGSRD